MLQISHTHSSKIEIQDELKIELKLLTQNLIYQLLDDELNCPANANLGKDETKKLLYVFKRYPKVIGYNIDNLKGISPFVCMHKILLKEDYKPSRDHQRRLNSNMIQLVKKEVLKIMDTMVIYPISYRKWLVLFMQYLRIGE